jgi:hypothetical protein
VFTLDVYRDECDCLLHSAGGPYITLFAISCGSQPGLCFSARQDIELSGLHCISRYPRGIVGKVLVSHLIVTGSIPTPAMIFLHGFYHELLFFLP